MAAKDRKLESQERPSHLALTRHELPLKGRGSHTGSLVGVIKKSVYMHDHICVESYVHPEQGPTINFNNIDCSSITSTCFQIAFGSTIYTFTGHKFRASSLCECVCQSVILAKFLW